MKQIIMEAKVRNELAVALTTYNASEQNIFLTLCYKVNKKEYIALEDNSYYIELTEKDMKNIIKKKLSKKEIKDFIDAFTINRITVKLGEDIKDMVGNVVFHKGEAVPIAPFPIFKVEKNKIRLTVDRRIFPLIDDLVEKFTLLDIEEFLSLKSTYSKNLYKLFKREKYDKSSLSVPLSYYRKYQNIENSYSDLRNLKKKTLDNPIKELNEKTTLNIKYEILKSGKGRGAKAEGVKFDFKDSIDLKKKSPKKKIEAIEAEVVERSEIDEKIAKSKTNPYISKVWNKRVDNKIKKIVNEDGEVLAIKVLDALYNLNQEITTTLVQYINGILKNIRLSGVSLKRKTISKNIMKDITPLKQVIKGIDNEDSVNIDELFKNKELIESAMKRCLEETGTSIEFLNGVKKKSKTMFINMIKPYIENKEEYVEVFDF